LRNSKSIIEEEKGLVTQMILLYCRKKHGGISLCDECTVLKEYAHKRLDKCGYGENKPACSKCPTHCYAQPYRGQIRQVMRFSDPRILLHYPVQERRHMLRYLKGRRPKVIRYTDTLYRFRRNKEEKSCAGHTMQKRSYSWMEHITVIGHSFAKSV